jgi:hypothetical protein
MLQFGMPSEFYAHGGRDIKEFQPPILVDQRARRGALQIAQRHRALLWKIEGILPPLNNFSCIPQVDGHAGYNRPIKQ